MKSELAKLVSLFQDRLYLPDPAPLLIVLGAVAANRLDGDPVWLLLVGPPGAGKTEILQSLNGRDIYAVSNLTEAGLLSGTAAPERADDATGGLLRVVGDRGIVVVKDFGSVLSMRSDARSSLLAALREIYDGAWTRVLGSDGGRTLPWTGKLGLLGGCTEEIEEHHAVMATMGERFALFRMPDLGIEGERELARRAFKGGPGSGRTREELSRAVSQFVAAEITDPRPTGQESDFDVLVNLGLLVARARSSVIRDGKSREITVIPGSEAPTRITKVLGQLWAGLVAIGLDPGEARTALRELALGCIPALRRSLLGLLHAATGPLTRNGLQVNPMYSASTVDRHLAELSVHGLAEKFPDARWSLSSLGRQLLDAVGFANGLKTEPGRTPESDPSNARSKRGRLITVYPDGRVEAA